ncbi:hypothetical protein, partial [Streptococcus sp. UMB0029]|uniref:hypothetical protein n=1 Tax=Streptococcus sp. UMB0029 TaxID=2069308 RepID=UPI0015E12DDD
MKLLQINLVSQDVVGSEIKDSYENEFFQNACTCSHIEIAKFPNEVPLLVEVEVSLIKILKTSGIPC